MAKGWKYEPERHALAAKGIKTAQRQKLIRPVIKSINTNAHFRTEKRYWKSNTEDYSFNRFKIETATRINRTKDRTVYKLPDGNILKVAHNPRGLLQNTYEGETLDILPELIEWGKDYVVVENCPRDDTRTNKFLKPLKENLDYNDWIDKGTKYQNEFSKLSKKYDEPDFDNVINYTVLRNDFLAPRNWGWKKDKPCLLDPASLDMDLIQPDKINQWRDEWAEVLSERRKAENKGFVVSK